MNDVLTVREAVTRCKADGLPISEYTLRQWIKAGAIPTRRAGQKFLIFYPNLIHYLQCTDGADNTPATDGKGAIRRLEVKL